MTTTTSSASSYPFGGAVFECAGSYEPNQQHACLSLINTNNISALQKIDFIYSNTGIYLMLRCEQAQNIAITKFLKEKGISEIRYGNVPDNPDTIDIDCRQFANMQKLFNIIKENSALHKNDSTLIENRIKHYDKKFEKNSKNQLPNTFFFVNEASTSFFSTFTFGHNRESCELTIEFRCIDKEDLFQLLQQKGIPTNRSSIYNGIQSISYGNLQDVQKVFDVIKDDSPISHEEIKEIEGVIKLINSSNSEKKEEKKS